MQQQHEFQVFEHFNGAAPSLQGTLINSIEASNVHNLLNSNLEITTQLEYHHLNAHQTSNEIFLGPSDIEQWEVDGISDFLDLCSNINPPPSAFLGPKCALWDCARPAQLSEGCKNYCSTFHAELAVKECPPGTAPVLRPGGIGLKDGPLFAALRAKVEGNDVGIPECEGAATAKSPWNAPGKHISSDVIEPCCLKPATHIFLLCVNLYKMSFSLSSILLHAFYATTCLSLAAVFLLFVHSADPLCGLQIYLIFPF